jgi:hypothetical protein
MSSDGSPAERLRRRILALPGIIEKGHRVSPHAYYVGGREIAHFHGPNQIDIHLTQVAQAEALARGLAEPHAHAAGAGWVTCRFPEPHSVETVLALVEKAHAAARARRARRSGKSGSDLAAA